MKNILFAVVTIMILCCAKVFTEQPPCYDHDIMSYPHPPLDYTPPLSVGMPLDVLLGYIVTDSVLHAADYNQFKDFLDRQTYNDTIRYIMKYYYKMIDYDPVRFHLYFNSPDEGKIAHSILYWDVMEKLKNVITNYSDYLLVYSDIIAHIRVTDTLSHIDTLSSTGAYKRSHLISAEILDKLKGQIIPYCNEYYSNIKKSDPDEIDEALPGQCIKFQYLLDWARGNVDMQYTLIGDDGYPWTNLQPKLIDSTGKPWLEKNKEYIIFFMCRNVCYDSTSNNEFFTFFPSGFGSMTFGMYPITNGFVSDPANEFGMGTNVQLETFKEGLENKIQAIINFGY